jgi:hypothetical protein
MEDNIKIVLEKSDISVSIGFNWSGKWNDVRILCRWICIFRYHKQQRMFCSVAQLLASQELCSMESIIVLCVKENQALCQLVILTFLLRWLHFKKTRHHKYLPKVFLVTSIVTSTWTVSRTRHMKLTTFSNSTLCGLFFSKYSCASCSLFIACRKASNPEPPFATGPGPAQTTGCTSWLTP